MIQLRPTKEWSGDNESNSLRLYVGSLFCGVAEPLRNEPEMYYFKSNYNCIDTSPKRQCLEDIKLQVELSLKEFANKFCYTNQIK